MRPEKKAIVEEFSSRLENSTFVVLTDYHGMSMDQMVKMRKELSPLNAEFHVIKNRLFKHAAAAKGLESLASSAGGPLAMINGSGDFTIVVKVLNKFVKEHEVSSPKAAAWDSKLLSVSELKMLAELPDKPVMQSILLAGLNAPMAQLVGVFSQKLLALLYCLNAIKETKQGKK